MIVTEIFTLECHLSRILCLFIPLLQVGKILNKNSYLSSPTIGREKELKNLMITLAQSKKSPLIVGESGVGKTTMMWVPKVYLKWKENKKPWIYLVRKSVEICEALITSIADTNLNKYTDDNVILTYTKGSFKDGITDVFINGELFFRI